MSSRALVIGEALVDVVNYRDGSVAELPGGSPANVALGLARLGREAELLAWLGHDAYGTLVADHLRASGVHIAEATWGAAATSVARATLDQNNAATYEFELEWALSPAAAVTDAPLVVHTGSIAAVLEPGASAVEALVREARATSTITYDPNARPSLMGTPAAARAKVEAMVALADVVKVSDEDIEWLTGEPVEAVAAAWLDLGPELVVVTRGGEGATAFVRFGRTFTVPAPRVDVVDTVGAGDSFMGGLIDGLWLADLLGADRRGHIAAASDEVLMEVLERCIRIGAITVSRAGANPPTAAELGEA